MRKDLRDFDGKEALFIDANIFLHHAFGSNTESVEFLKRVESFNFKVYTSALVLEEIVFKLLMQSASNFLDKVTMQGVKALLKDIAKRKRIFHPIAEYMKYIGLLKESGLVIIDLKDGDMMTAVERARDYGLITADAAHVAVMERKGIRHLASGDADFVTLRNITVWSPVER